ncbi:hypothetical protein ST47_g5955 [Ascochyta rabiei]|uniref:Uncharacterized protein n=1 Tax=Didymella rabiei TaxID=5454 RepID=A0A163D3C4_DIDRA|nr:hypothetical protein ST47_g5955 [Ascochyta rabiei]
MAVATLPPVGHIAIDKLAMNVYRTSMEVPQRSEAVSVGVVEGEVILGVRGSSLAVTASSVLALATRAPRVIDDSHRKSCYRPMKDSDVLWYASLTMLADIAQNRTATLPFLPSALSFATGPLQKSSPKFYASFSPRCVTIRLPGAHAAISADTTVPQSISVTGGTAMVVITIETNVFRVVGRGEEDRGEGFSQWKSERRQMESRQHWGGH